MLKWETAGVTSACEERRPRSRDVPLAVLLGESAAPALPLAKPLLGGASGSCMPVLAAGEPPRPSRLLLDSLVGVRSGRRRQSGSVASTASACS